MIVVYTVLSLVILWIAGFIFIKLLKCENNQLFANSFMLYIFFGCIGVVSFIMILGLVLPINIVAIILCVSLGIIFITSFKEIFNIVINIGKDEKLLLGIATIPMIIGGLPQILENELYISVLGNSDFGYYIASIEWLKNHSILQSVEYSLQNPFYSMAEYMIDYTRIGMDVLGAFLGNIFGLEAHEIFPILGVIAITLIFLVSYEVIFYFTQKHLISVTFGLFAALNGNIVTLIGKPYVPQLFGISMLIMAFFTVDLLFKEPNNRKNIILCGMTLSGLLTFYCEFAVYITLFILLYIIIYLKKRKNSVVGMIYACIYTVVFNPYGMYKALKFNLSIFTRVSTQGAQDIDAYGGNMLGIEKIIGCLFGFSDCFLAKSAYFKIAIASGIIIVSICIMLIIKNKTDYKKFVLVTIIIFTMLELYFRYSHGAYQEYKHITSITVIIIMLMGCVIGAFFKEYHQIKFVQYIVVMIIFAIGVCGIYNPLKHYCKNKVTVDSQTMLLREAVEQNVPISTEIEIDSSISIANYMAATYALKDHNVNLNTDSLSYLQYFQHFEDNDLSKYVLYEKGKEYFSEEDYKIIWSNKKYVLLERIKVEDYTVLDITSGGFASNEGVFVSDKANYVENRDGHEGMVLYGPYVHIGEGKYEIVVNYTVIDTKEKSGYFDIYTEGEEKYYQDLETTVGNHKIVINNQLFTNEDNVEFRVYANEGTIIRVNGIKYRRISDET